MNVEEKLAKTEQELEIIKKEYAEFAYIISHDFSAPFRQIEGFSNIIMRKHLGDFDEKTQHHMKLILKGAQEGKTYVQSLLQFSRLNTQADEFSSVDLNQIIDECRTTLKAVINEAGAEITCDSLPTIEADKHQIFLLFYHILKNALMYQVSGQKPTISIHLKQAEDEWSFSIQDNGIGIKESMHEKVFLPLRRAVSDDDYPDGNGMGLAVAKKIVRRHGGDISILSEEGKGTTVTFTLS